MQQKKCKLIVSDFDGTLAGASGVVSQKNRLAIEKHIKNGGYFTIATGRMKCGLQYAVRDINVNAPLASCQGAVIFDPKSGKTLEGRFIDHNLTVELLKLLRQKNYDVNLYIDDKLYFFGEYWYAKKYANDNNLTLDEVIISPNLIDFVVENKCCAQKILACVEPDLAEKLEQEHSKLFLNKLLVVRSSSRFVEYNALNASKGNAVKYIADLLNIKKEEIMCMGDSSNDISMFEECGVSVALGNAMPHVKSAAQFVVKDCKDDGAAEAIERFGM